MDTGVESFGAASKEDLYNMLRKEGDSLLDLSALEETTFDLDIEASSDFFENYTDLSALFFNDDAMDPNPEAPDAVLEDHVFSVASTSSMAEVGVSVESAATVAKANRKRKSSPTTSSVSAPPDHSGYTSKAKRARISSTATTVSDLISDESDEEMVSTSAASKETKYKERRRKNNIASRRSRETRKQKFVSMEGKALELEASNAELRVRVEELEALAKEMKDTLIKRLAQTK